MSQNGQTHFKNLAANAARLKISCQTFCKKMTWLNDENGERYVFIKVNFLQFSLHSWKTRCTLGLAWTTSGTKYSRMDQMKFMEGSLLKKGACFTLECSVLNDKLIFRETLQVSFLLNYFIFRNSWKYWICKVLILSCMHQ